jgi:hypothetical protein
MRTCGLLRAEETTPLRTLLRVFLVGLVGTASLPCAALSQNHQTVANVRGESPWGLAEKMAAFAQELQQERSLALRHFSSRREDDTAPVSAQWTKSDQRLQELEAVLTNFDLDQLPAGPRTAIADYSQRTKGHFARLEAARGMMQNLIWYPYQIDQYYTPAIASLLGAVELIAPTLPDAKLSATAQAYAALLHVYEYACSELDLITALSANEGVSSSRLTAVVSAQEGYIEAFMTKATSEQKGYFREQMNGPFAEAIAAGRTAAYAAREGPLSPGTLSAWRTAQIEKLARFKRVLTALTDEVAHRERPAREAWPSVIGIVAGALLLLVAGLLFVLARRPRRAPLDVPALESGILQRLKTLAAGNGEGAGALALESGILQRLEAPAAGGGEGGNAHGDERYRRAEEVFERLRQKRDERLGKTKQVFEP